MQLKAGEDFDLPEAIDPNTSMFAVYTNGHPRKNPGSYAMRSALMRFDALMLLREKDPDLLGFPNSYAVTQNCKRLLFYPLPDQDYDAILQYHPALKEI